MTTAALLVRLAYLFQIRGTPLTDVLLVDSDTYDRFARRNDLNKLRIGFKAFLLGLELDDILP